MKINMELMNHIRLESGISRTADGGFLVCINRDGNIIDPLEGLALFTEMIVKECIDVVEDKFWSDPHEVYQALDLIKNHFMEKVDAL